MTDLPKDAETIYLAYVARSHHSPFEDAVISFLYLFARWLMAEKKTTNKK
jgi:hypothetical protein